MASTQVRRVVLQVSADDGDTEEKIERIKAAADELAEKHPELKVRIDEAAARAKLKVIRDELADVGKGLPPVVPEVEDAPADERITALQVRLGALREQADMAMEVNVDDDAAEAKLLRLQAQLESLNETIARPEISDAGIAKARADLADLQLRLAALTAEPPAPVPVEVDTTPAVEGVERLQARLAVLTAKAADIKVDDTDARIKLLRLQAQLLELGDKVARPDIKVQGVLRAEADIAAVSLELDKLGEKKPGLLSRLFGGGGEGGGGEGAALPDALPLVGGMGPYGLLGIAAGGMAALPEVGGLVTGLSAATLGVGSFAALAVPTFKQVEGAIGDTKAQLDKLPWPIRQSVGEIQNIKTQYDGMSKSFSPIVSNLASQGLGIVSDNMGKLLPLAQAAAPAISGLMTGLGKELSSPEFGTFLKFMESLEGPVLKAVGSGLHGVGDRLMSLMEMFSKKDVINAINIAFRLIGFTLQEVQGLMLEGMDAWDLLTAGLHNAAAWFDRVRHAAASFGHGVAHDFDVVRHGVAELGHDVAHYFDDARHDVAEAGHDIAHTFDNVRHGIAEFGHDAAHYFDDFKHDVLGVADWIGDHWRIIIAYLVDPVNTAIYEIRAHWHQVESDTDHMRHEVAADFDGLRHDIASWADDVPRDVEHAWDTARHDTAAFGDWLVHEVESAFDDIKHLTETGMDDARHSISSGWDGARHDTAAGWDGLVHEVESGVDDARRTVGELPGDIMRILDALPGDLEHAGENAIDGLISGIESGIGEVESVMSGIAHKVEDFFTDPLKMASPSRVMMQHGLMVSEGIALGIESGVPRVGQAMRRVTDAVTVGHGSTAGGYGAAGGPVRIEFAGGADDELWTLIKKHIRVTGGNVTVVGR